MNTMPRSLAGAALALAVMTVGAAAASARPAAWNEPAWSGRAGEIAPSGPGRSHADSREGRIQASRFVTEDAGAQALGHGAIEVTSQSDDENFVAAADRAVFEAAVIDRLVQAGYDTATKSPDGGQITELRIVRRVLQPAEAPRKPVSGSATMEVGNRGSAYGMAIAVDLTKPLPALVSTRLEARIRDRATNAILWEGRAEVAAREGDEKWSTAIIASRLAEALFDGFPRPS